MLKDKEKYYQKIEKDIINTIYEESIKDGTSYLDRFIKIAKNYDDVEPYTNYIDRCVMANDAEALVYLIVSNKLVRYDNAIYNVINNEIKDKLDEKQSLDIIRILVRNKYVQYASRIMTKDLYYKVHFLEDLSFLGSYLENLYLFGDKSLPSYFINQFNDFELNKDKERVLDILIKYYEGILNEVPKYYHSFMNGNTLELEYPSEVNKSEIGLKFTFIDLKELNYKGEKIKDLIDLENKIRNLVRR